MIRLLVRTVIAVAANAVGLIVASLVLDGFSINVASFIVAVVIFTIVFAVLTPFLAVQLRRLGHGAIGATALIATLGSLLVTDLISDGFSINVASFVVAVVIFTIVFAVLTPFLAVQLRRLGNGAIGATALIATLVSLVITDLLSDGFTISGVGTWIAAAVIVWLAALVAAFVLPFLGLKKFLEDNRR